MDAIISLDRNLTITFWNYGAQLTFGYSRKEAIGKNFEKVISPKEFDIKITTITGGLLDDLEWRGEIIHKRKDESLLFCVVSISKLKIENEHFEYLLISRDVSERKEAENLQRLNDALEKQLSSTVELTGFFQRINDGFYSLDKNWCFTRLNKKAGSLLRREPASLVGKQIWAEFPSWKKASFLRVYTNAMESQQYAHMEEYDDVLDKWFHTDIYPNGDLLSVFFHDISEEKRAERQVKESEELYRKVIEIAQEGIWIINEHNRTTFVNASMAEILACEADEIIGRDIFDFFDEDSRVGLRYSLGAEQPAIRKLNDISLVTKEGKKKWVIINSSSIFRNKQYSGTLVTVMDVTDRRTREAELKETHQQLRNLASRLQVIREEERAALARELHDELGQQLTAFKIDIYRLYKNLPEQDIELRAKVEAILQMVNDSLPKIEKKAIELHPSLLYDLGLLAAIEWQNKQFRSRNDAQIYFTFVGSDKCLTNDVALALYRIYQEALTNITRHASATVITATYVQNDDSVKLMISDNGRGFVVNRMDKRKTLGLLSMKERSIVVGGECEISSFPEKGTVVSVTVPLKDTNN